ncbi:GrpB family protein [Rhizobium sp. AN80A]|uniref:GrpB family protein n=1 Tax=Rhizobium sp. AN80A TaxID=3040673 RepID=UPI0024B35AB6|nr:GrpB family protein [Rhizobium sp. AN80A]
MPERVEIVPYDAEWPTHFREIAASLKTLLGDRVLDIHHIGSTSIPGVAAKPLIDIDVILPTAADVIDACPLMETTGYEPRGNRYDADIFAFMKHTAAPRQRIYLCPEGHDTHQRRILFRDYLRTHPQAAADYQALKLELVEAFEYDGDGYTAAKAAFVNDIVARAGRR